MVVKLAVRVCHVGVGVNVCVFRERDGEGGRYNQK